MLPNNAYTHLRFEKFNGGRIRHDFGDGCVVQETYNRGIYNCECDGELIQIYDGAHIAQCIIDDDRAAYRRAFTEWFSAKMESEVVNNAIAPFGERVRAEKDKYVIDNVWAVGHHGGAMQRASDGDWRNLCLVADPTNEQDIMLPGRSAPVRVNSRTWVVIGKILFLLFPRPERIFMGQLPKNLQDMVRRSYAQSGTICKK